MDIGAKCEEWKGKGYCENEYVTFMTRLCRKTCDKCYKEDDGGDDDTDDDDNDGGKGHSGWIWLYVSFP